MSEEQSMASVGSSASGEGSDPGIGGVAAPWASGAPMAATRGKYYRNARLLMVALMLGLGGWFIKDGFYSYPKANEDAIKKARDNGETDKFDKDGKFVGKPEHSDTDIALQKVLGFLLIPVGFGYLFFFLNKSRGAYRMEGDVISIPGHPDFRVAEVQRVDKRLWDRKGIAKVDYKTAAGATGTVTLDDFIYDRPPTDAIYYRMLMGFEYGGPDHEYYVQSAYWAAEEYLKTPMEKKPMGGVDEMAYRLLDNTEDWKKAYTELSKAYDPATNSNPEAVERFNELAAAFEEHHRG